MIKERLLERLTREESPKLSDRRSHEELVMESIKRHLSKLLNVRRGSVPIDPDYGMSDMCNIAGSFAYGSVSDIQRDILIQVETYEKRFLNPRIMQLTESREVITLKFQLIGQIDIGSGSSSNLKDFSMFLRINSAGQIRLEIASGV